MKFGGSPTCLFILIITACIFGLTGCESESSVDPSGSGVDLEGAWLGYGMSGPCGEDWSQVRFVIHQTGTSLEGHLDTGTGTQRSVSGDIDASTAHLEIGELPGTSECSQLSLWLDLDSDESDLLNGNATGRCCGTVAYSFYWKRD